MRNQLTLILSIESKFYKPTMPHPPFHLQYYSTCNSARLIFQSDYKLTWFYRNEYSIWNSLYDVDVGTRTHVLLTFDLKAIFRVSLLGSPSKLPKSKIASFYFILLKPYNGSFLQNVHQSYLKYWLMFLKKLKLLKLFK